MYRKDDGKPDELFPKIGEVLRPYFGEGEKLEMAKVDACIKDLSRQTEGEIHRVCAKALDIDKSKSK